MEHEIQEKPKKPINYFLRYRNENIEEFKKMHETDDLVSLNKAMTDAFNALSEDEKAVYKDAYNQEYAKYKEEIAEYHEKHGPIKGTHEKGSGSTSDDEGLFRIKSPSQSQGKSETDRNNAQNSSIKYFDEEKLSEKKDTPSVEGQRSASKKKSKDTPMNSQRESNANGEMAAKPNSKQSNKKSSRTLDEEKGPSSGVKSQRKDSHSKDKKQGSKGSFDKYHHKRSVSNKRNSDIKASGRRDSNSSGRKKKDSAQNKPSVFMNDGEIRSVSKNKVKYDKKKTDRRSRSIKKIDEEKPVNGRKSTKPDSRRTSQKRSVSNTKALGKERQSKSGDKSKVANRKSSTKKNVRQTKSDKKPGVSQISNKQKRHTDTKASDKKVSKPRRAEESTNIASKSNKKHSEMPSRSKAIKKKE
jgi:hypothetical protein